jgi:hypothetical protein
MLIVCYAVRLAYALSKWLVQKAQYGAAVFCPSMGKKLKVRDAETAIFLQAVKPTFGHA